MVDEASEGRLVFLTPGLPPHRGGVCHYTAILTELLRNSYNREVLCIVPDSYEEPDPAGPPWVYTKASAKALLDVCYQNLAATDTIIVEMSGYGFHPWGAPRWIVEGLSSWKMQSGCRVIVNFHELCIRPFSGFPKTLIYYALQRRTIRLLSRLADTSICSVQSQKTFLENFVSPESIHVLAVSSAVGEAERSELKKTRENILFLFGLSDHKERVLCDEGASVDAFCKRYGIEKIVEAGPAMKRKPSLATEIDSLGYLEYDELKTWLLKSRFGVFHHDPDRLNVSGVLAGYLSHGVTPINVHPAMREIVAESPLVFPVSADVKPHTPYKLWKYYSENRSLKVHAETLLTLSN